MGKLVGTTPNYLFFSFFFFSSLSSFFYIPCFFLLFVASSLSGGKYVGLHLFLPTCSFRFVAWPKRLAVFAMCISVW